MMRLALRPKRIRGHEILDEDGLDPKLVVRSMRDVARSNFFFGGASAAVAEMRGVFDKAKGTLTLLDVGTGVGDICVRARRKANQTGISVLTVGIDAAEELARASRAVHDAVVCGDGLSLPFPDRSFDIVMGSQILHHFDDASAVSFLSEMNRVARTRVVVSEIRRSWLAMIGLWIGSYLLRFHPVSRHDGLVSIRRGFTPPELIDLVERAVGRTPAVAKRPLFRVTTGWTPA
jgi:2-polyprenyl-3-methyl-5-hydroxy-6-metoxy-1,4-benzoquinol methylase